MPDIFSHADDFILPPGLSPRQQLDALAAAEETCRRCPLYRNATQAVPGEGPAKARIVMVGEQPGDQEDLQGKPFVGPAGRILDKALNEIGLDRRKVFVTNAVKHFKWEARGKRRLHKTPSAGEVTACRFWLDRELAAIRPNIVVALGATATRAVIGPKARVTRDRGRILKTAEGLDALATVHPSFLLRVQDEDRAREYAAFVRDLRTLTD